MVEGERVEDEMNGDDLEEVIEKGDGDEEKGGKGQKKR